uniref:VIT family protein n=1 Tax=Thermofilum pendens TaxID=2269 RepID=A0A7C3WKF5_THEPE
MNQAPRLTNARRLGSGLGEVFRILASTDFPSIARRYFVMNCFDGVMTMMGFILGYFFSGGSNPGTAVGAGVAASIAMGVSGFTGALLTEFAERARELEELERAMLKDLTPTVFGRALRVAALAAAVVDALAPAAGAMTVAAPVVLSSMGLVGFPTAVTLSTATGLLVLFALGYYMGRIAEGRPLLYGAAMAGAGALVSVAVTLLGGA